MGTTISPDVRYQRSKKNLELIAITKRVVFGVLRHPISRKGQVAAIKRFLAWQIKANLTKGPHQVPWINNSKFYASIGEAGITGNIYNGLYEFQDMAFLLHFLLEGDLFVDVGANSGAYTILASKVVGARTIAFEPVDSSMQRLKDNVELNNITDRTELRQQCVGDKRCAVQVSKKLDAMNHIEYPGSALRQFEEVRMVKLDDVLVDIPQMVKIDVEGYEFNVLRGADRILRKSSLKVVIVEVNGSGRKYGISDSETIQNLCQRGFEAYRYDPFARALSKIVKSKRNSGNIIFLRDIRDVEHRIKNARSFTVYNVEV